LSSPSTVSLVHCVPAGSLVGARLWLPTEPFDYVWGRFGCNHLRCGACGQPVTSSLDAAKRCRSYACACQSRDEYGHHVLGADAGQLHEFVTAWACAGHPALHLPVQLDGVAITAVGPFGPIVSQALANPPFVAPGYRTQSFWVQRLFRLLPAAAQQAQVGHAVAAELSNADARVARAVMDFFVDLPWAPGADQLAVVAERDRDRLRATPDPGSQISPASSLYARILEAIEARLLVQRDGGGQVDQPALELARRALVAGEAATSMVFRVAARDPAWFCEHAAEIVRAQPAELEFVLEGLKGLPPAGRAKAVSELLAINKTTDKAVRAWLQANPTLATEDDP